MTRTTLLNAWKDLLRLRREPLSLAAWIGIPVLIALMLSVLFGRGEAKVHGLVLVADHDASLVSRMVSSALGQGELGKMLTVEQVEEAEGRARMERGDASALVVLPKGMGDALLNGTAMKLVVVKNPSQQIVPQLVEQVVGLLGEAAFYVHELAGEELKTFAGREGLDDAGVGALSERFSRVIRAASRWNRVELKTEEVKEKQSAAPGGIGARVMPGMLILALLFAASGLASDWWKEKQAWTLRRAMSMPFGLAPVVGGKTLSYAVVVALLAVAGLALGHGLLAMPVARPVLAVAWMVVAGVVMFLVLTLLQTAASTRRTAEVASNLVVMPLMLAGGSLLPFEEMPPSMAAIARWTPNGAALVVLRRLLEGTPGPVVLPFAIALAAAALLGWACARRVSGRFAL